MTTILINGAKSSSDAALNALAAYVSANPGDEAMTAKCPNGGTLGDLMYVLRFGAGLEGCPVDAEYAEVCARAGVSIDTVPQYVVHADAESGMWAGKPELVGRVEMWRWLLRKDTDSAHYDSAIIDGDDAAIEVRWLA